MNPLVFDAPQISVYVEKINGETVAAGLRCMTDDEMEAVSIAKSEKRRREMIVTRLVIKNIFGRNVLLEHNPDGSPFINGIDKNISVSHSGETVCVAVSETKIGVDVQYWSNSLINAASKYLNEEELSAFSLADREQLLRAWTIKEAVYKLSGIKDLSLKAIDTRNEKNAVVNIGKELVNVPVYTHISTDFAISIACK